MNKRDTLKGFIQNSSLLAPDIKQRLLESVHTMSDTDIESISKFFSAEQKDTLETNDVLIRRIDEVLEILQK
jgi:galactokinase